MRTGPTNRETKSIAVMLERHGKKSRKKIFTEIAEKLLKPSRKRACVNIFKLNEIAKTCGEKVLIVPGKVLASGDLEKKIEVACLNCSATAKRKIESMKGKVIELKEIIGISPNKMVIVE
jgi:large subunit ribosomal protein L18e